MSPKEIYKFKADGSSPMLFFLKSIKKEKTLCMIKTDLSDCAVTKAPLVCFRRRVSDCNEQYELWRDLLVS